MSEFKTENGMYIIMAKGKKLYMRSHPRTMLNSMRSKKHDRFIAFSEPETLSKSLKDFDHMREIEVVLNIMDLITYVASCMEEDQ